MNKLDMIKEHICSLPNMNMPNKKDIHHWWRDPLLLLEPPPLELAIFNCL